MKRWLSEAQGRGNGYHILKNTKLSDIVPINSRDPKSNIVIVATHTEKERERNGNLWYDSCIDNMIIVIIL